MTATTVSQNSDDAFIERTPLTISDFESMATGTSVMLLKSYEVSSTSVDAGTVGTFEKVHKDYYGGKIAEVQAIVKHLCMFMQDFELQGQGGLRE